MLRADTSVLPAVDLGTLAQRAVVPTALAVAAAVAVVVAGGPLHAFADAVGRALDADPRGIAAAAVFELLSFVGYVALLWLVGRRASARLGCARAPKSHWAAPPPHVCCPRAASWARPDDLGLPARGPRCALRDSHAARVLDRAQHSFRVAAEALTHGAFSSRACGPERGPGTTTGAHA